MQTERANSFNQSAQRAVCFPPTCCTASPTATASSQGSHPTDYHLAPGERLGEAATRSWNRLLGAWAAFDEARAGLPAGDAGGQLTRERWLQILFDELSYGRLVKRPAVEIEGKSYPIFTQWQHTPIHLVGCGVAIDRRTPGVAGAAGQSPHSLCRSC